MAKMQSPEPPSKSLAEKISGPMQAATRLLRRLIESAVPYAAALWRRRWVKLAATAAAVCLVVLAVAAEVLARRALPLLRAQVVTTLTAKFHAPVTLNDLNISVLRGLQVEATGLRIPVAAAPGQPAVAYPLLNLQRFRFRVSLGDLLRLREHIETVHIEGLEVHIPASQSQDQSGGQGSATPADNSAVAMSVGHIVCNDASIYIESGKPGGPPLHFDVENLDLKDISTTTAVPYSADIVYAKPAVRVHVAGNFGPWNSATPGATPLDGSYSTNAVDLDAITGLRGKLTSKGRFAGKLAGVVVDGQVDAPALALAESAHPVKMDATFHLTVDGTTGDTSFAPVRVLLPRGEIVAEGKMHLVPGDGPASGPDIDMELAVPRGRIEELLELGTNTQPTLMKGNLTMHTHLHIPPGPQGVEQRFVATGSLAIESIQMGDPKLQQSINSLSGISQGNLKVLTGVLPVGGSATPPVSSNITATFALDHGMMTVPSLVYTVPGSKVQLAGVYSLARNAFEFKGHYMPDALSKTPAAAPQAPPPGKGLKGVGGKLLGKLAPVLQKVTNVQVPVAITGVASDVKLGLTDKADESTAQMAVDVEKLHGH